MKDKWKWSFASCKSWFHSSVSFAIFSNSYRPYPTPSFSPSSPDCEHDSHDASVVAPTPAQHCEYITLPTAAVHGYIFIVNAQTHDPVTGLWNSWCEWMLWFIHELYATRSLKGQFCGWKFKQLSLRWKGTFGNLFKTTKRSVSSEQFSFVCRLCSPVLQWDTSFTLFVFFWFNK